jgi:hypothetical protein
MTYTYCRDWARHLAAPTEVWDEQKARRAHERGKLYTVLVGTHERPECFLHVRLELKYIGVNFLDRFFRVNLSFQFEEIEPGRMFLERAIEVEFDRDAPQDLSPNEARSIREIRTVFKPTGWVDIWRRDVNTGNMEHAEGPQDVARCWEPLPRFGDYAGVIRRER